MTSSDVIKKPVNNFAMKDPEIHIEESVEKQ